MNLTFGKNKKGEWQHISTVRSGKTDLVCPFCNGRLLARKGIVNEHHFAHAGETCIESSQVIEASKLPTIDTSEVLTKKELKYLERRERFSHKNIFYFKGMDDALDSLEAMGILTVVRRKSDDLKEALEKLNRIDKELVDENLVGQAKLFAINDALSNITELALRSAIRTNTSIDTKINREFSEQLPCYNDNIKRMLDIQAFWLDAHHKKQQKLCPESIDMIQKKVDILSSQHLYLFRFKIVLDGELKDVAKIGMTSRNIEERYSEVLSELSKVGRILQGEIMASAQFAGRIERLLHRKYSRFQIPIAKHREYFDAAIIWDLLPQFEEVRESKPFKLHKIATVKIPKACKKTQGRKAKTTEHLLREYQSVVTLLRQNLSIRQIAAETGYSSTTVQKVKRAYYKQI